jgi:serine protease Do
MFCTKCGAENPENSNFCRKCGTVLIQVTPLPQPSANASSDMTHSTPGKQSKIWRVLFIVTAIILLIVVAVSITVPISYYNSEEGQISSLQHQLSSVNSQISSLQGQLSSANSDSVANAIAEVRPSVVAITAQMTVNTIFGSTTQQVEGSGWIIDSNGLVVTNNHVVEGASPDAVTVTMENGQSYTAKSIRTDPIDDLAVIDIGIGNLPTINLGDSSKLRVGDFVVAVGNALGQGISATFGIVSATGYTITVGSNETLYDLILTSAPVNPGNSGGPLVNLAGQVVGIVVAKAAGTGIEAQGYVIPSNTTQPIIQDLITKGFVTRAWVGIRITTVDAASKAQYRLSVDKGAVIITVTSGSPADKAGLKAYDVIVKFAGKDIGSADDLVQAIRSSNVGQPVDVVYYRGSTQNTTRVTPIESPLATP